LWVDNVELFVIGDITAKYYLESMTQKLYQSWV